MISLVKRLRNHKHNETLNKADLEKLCKEAAEKIEELERHYKTSISKIANLEKQIVGHKRKQVSMRNQNLRTAQEARRVLLTRDSRGTN